MKLLSFLLFLLLVALPAQAQFSPSPNDPQAPVNIARFQGDLTDFDTVEILCYSETTGDYISTSLCTAADVEIRSLAQRYHLNVRQGGGNETSHGFTLYVYITSAGTAPRGIAVHIEASKYMKEAVDQAAGYRDPASFRRSGKLVMFEETITGVGQGDSLEEPMRRRVRGVIRTFFQTYFKE